jgi:hypothetical protein
MFSKKGKYLLDNGPPVFYVLAAKAKTRLI